MLMRENEFAAAICRSGLQLTQETMTELRRASFILESLVEQLSGAMPMEAEPATMFYAEQRQ
jgi:hypothetical protein